MGQNEKASDTKGNSALLSNATALDELKARWGEGAPAIFGQCVREGIDPNFTNENANGVLKFLDFGRHNDLKPGLNKQGQEAAKISQAIIDSSGLPWTKNAQVPSTVSSEGDEN